MGMVIIVMNIIFSSPLNSNRSFAALESKAASTTKSGLDFFPNPQPSKVTLTFTLGNSIPNAPATAPLAHLGCGDGAQISTLPSSL